MAPRRAGARRWARPAGMTAGATLPRSADTSGGGVVLGVVRGPSTRVLRTKGPSTTSSTERISQAVTWCPFT